MLIGWTLGIIVLGLAVAAAAGEQAETVRTVYTVEGMHCGGCSAAITAALEKVEGVVEASADHEKGLATAVYDPREVGVEELQAVIEKLGYTVTGAKTEAVKG
jgi:Cu2+-exporting ATPase